MNNKFILLAVVIALGISFEVKAEQKKQPQKPGKIEQPKIGGTLVYGLGKEFSNPNPFVQTSSTNQFVKETSYESLLALDDDDNIIPNLATAYEVSAGGTVFTLHLRKGVKFHNGKEMKADDVLWSANHVKDPKNGAFGQNILNEVRSVEKIDDYTVRFTLPISSVIFPFHLAKIRMLPIVPANSLQPGQIKLEANTFVPGTGPFIFEQYQPGFDTVLKKYPEYWGGPAYLDKLIFRAIADDSNRFNALRSGDMQMADRLSPIDVDRVKKGNVKGIKMLVEPFGGFSHMIFNFDNPLFQRLEMRQALENATDKQRLIDEVCFGAATKADIMMDPKGIWAKAANIPPHKRDLAKAKALLKAAGYKGEEIALIGRKSEIKFAEAYQRMLGEAGIKIKVEILDAGTMNERFMSGKYDLYSAGGDTTSDPVTSMMRYYYTNKVEKGRYSNPKVDKLFDNLSSEFDQKKRLIMFRELAWTLHNEVADIPLLYELRFTGLSDKVHGYGPPEGRTYSLSGRYFKRAWLN